MIQSLDSVLSFERLWSSRFRAGFGIFFGAGVSRDPPTNGPIWTEMQAGFMSALFDRMQADEWPAAESFPDDRRAAHSLAIRPEVFWRRILEFCEDRVVWRALEAAGVDRPNANHDWIAALLQSGRCQLAMTTNFDEHIEALLGSEVPVHVPTSSEGPARIKMPTYVKLHGTLSRGSSLSYTLEHYDDLKDRNSELIRSFGDAPLVIMGYSGFDTDVLPALEEIASTAPCVVVVRHPGSSSEQPIFELATMDSSAYLLEATCSEVLRILAVGLQPCGYENVARRRDEDRREIYTDASKMIPVPVCPVILMIAFSLTGNWDMVHRYGWLAHDACVDCRYQDQLTPRLAREIRLSIAYSLRLAGDESGARIMLAEAKGSLGGDDIRVSDALRVQWMEAYTRNAPDQSAHSAGRYMSTLSNEKSEPSEVLRAQLAFLERFSSSSISFVSYWQLGVALRREGKLELAIEAFEKGATLVRSGSGTHLEHGRFLLDFAGALFDYCLKHQSAEIREQANTLYQVCEKISADAGDWITNAGAQLMLARVLLSAEEIERARERSLEALESVKRTDDSALRARIEEFASALEKLLARRST